MENNPIGCRSGRTILVDPNKFGGQSSSSNISEPLEDLIISVELETTKKERTILTKTATGNVGVNSDAVRVRFIEGNEVGGKNVLTTKYTDLTTSFESGNDGNNETLGITSIDIDFNSSMAPLITIQFIDAKGSTIFQNQESLFQNKNKYSTFFELPYPLYKLTVKGYYGMPVSYTLHMTKFSAKFNSQTGNFEITANFVGYTYALLSDMLLGFLRAIPYTEEGGSKFTELLQSQPSLLTLDEFVTNLSKLNENIKKLKENDEGIGQLNSGKTKLENLTAIKSYIQLLGSEIDVNSELVEYPYIFLKKSAEVNQTPSAYAPTTSDSTTIALKKYDENVSGEIKKYNDKNTKYSITESDFLSANFKKYTDLSLNLLNPYSVGNTIILKSKFGQQTDDEFEKTRDSILSYGRDRGYGADTLFDVYDLTKPYAILKEKETGVTQEIKELEKTVSETLRAKTKDVLGIDPSVRNIVGLFTSAVEVFLSSLFRVSEKAITSDKTIRENQLKKFEIKQFDIKNNAIGNTPNNAPSGNLSSIYYPWPEYRKIDEKNGLIEQYLGDIGVLSVPNDVTEIRFINDLYNAFIKSNTIVKKAQIASEKDTTNWVAVNPLDTRLLGNDMFPYKRIKPTTPEQVISLLLIRTFISLGYSNAKLTQEEIKTIIESECDSIIKDIDSDNLKLAISQLKDSDIINAKALNNGELVPIMKKLNFKYSYTYTNNQNVDEKEYYYYNYIWGEPLKNPNGLVSSVADSNSKHLLPVTNPLIGNFKPYNALPNAKSGELFLTNYTTTRYDQANNEVYPKPYDGGIYLKIIKPADYLASAKPIPSITPTENILNFDGLHSNTQSSLIENTDTYKQIGFNVVGGQYGIQDFTLINFGSEIPKGPYRAVFYSDGNSSYKGGSRTYNNSNGLALKRKKDVTTPYDIANLQQKTYKIANGDNGAASAVDNVLDFVSDTPVNESYGKNRLLLTDYSTNKSPNITYPGVNFFVEFDTDDGNFPWNPDLDFAPVSLFGSKFYYGQNNDYSKAFLFLHTFPWNGLCYESGDRKEKTIFSYTNEILNTFGVRAGFISTPKLWSAFIGGLLWRVDTTKPNKNNLGVIIDGGSGPNDPIIWNDTNGPLIPTFRSSTNTPARDEYLTSEYDGDFPAGPMIFSNRVSILTSNYKPLDMLLLQLPDQVKNEFKQVFFDFVAKKDGTESDWQRVKKELEVFNGNSVQWQSTWNNVVKYVNSGGALIDNGLLKGYSFDIGRMINFYNVKNGNKYNFENYIVFTPYFDVSSMKYNYYQQIRDGSSAANLLVDLFSEELIIANMTYKIWTFTKVLPILNTNQKAIDGIYVPKSDVDFAINTAISKFKTIKLADIVEKNKQNLQETFGSTNENLIKAQLYRTCKNIYDKWIGGASNESTIIFRDGVSGRNGIDIQLAIASGRNENNLALIDSFRFVDRTFSDIGDKLVINPLPVSEDLTNNPNSSFYDSVSNLLSHNNFDFVPLPSFINYGDAQTLESIFKPITTGEEFAKNVVGPSFVCIYVGQTSKNLDISGSEYPNDGVSFNCDSDGNLIIKDAKNFTNDPEPYENNVAVFAVNYSQQNQNIFKDIIIDQSEFSESAESLQIIDEIANKGAENRTTLGGQNMYNIYSVRSYKVDVEMMGNAMIQPMMYFQLNNIPMFHGAYLIQHVKHSIKPNYMSTNFTGVRIKNVETPLSDFTQLFMSILDSVEASKENVSSGNFGSANTSQPVNGTRELYKQFVDYDVLETDSLKYQEKSNGVFAKGDTYTMKEAGEFMTELAKKWYLANKNLTNTDTIYVNNFGAKGGGTNKSHGSKDGGLHGVGLACDLQPMAKTKGQQRCIVNDTNYDQAKNIEFIQMAIDLHNSQDKIKIQNIILNDPVIINNFSGVTGSQGKIVRSSPGHENHIHIEFDYPPRVVVAVKNKQPKDELIVTSGVKGTANKIALKLPTESERLSALGKI